MPQIRIAFVQLNHGDIFCKCFVGTKYTAWQHSRQQVWEPWERMLPEQIHSGSVAPEEFSSVLFIPIWCIKLHFYTKSWKNFLTRSTSPQQTPFIDFDKKLRTYLCQKCTKLHFFLHKKDDIFFWEETQSLPDAIVTGKKRRHLCMTVLNFMFNVLKIRPPAWKF